ncbi:MAG: pyrimidine dimer DNA glycosylase/endonuclease V [Acidimicrobiia bacterium]|nr:pyrimidine dimer DNA glycosylase/endonuclease V [Acidimicrobiia bacterium]
MQLFATSPDPVESAKALDDKRVNKMTIETAQIICTAEHLNGRDAPYKPTHVHHPCVKWSAESLSNLSWVIFHHLALADLYTHVTGKTHLSFTKVGKIYEHLADWSNLPSVFVNCACDRKSGIDFTHVEDVHEAYRLYLCARWPNDKRPPVWKNRAQPDWK